ncbi:glutathione S-transferase [Rhizobium miluonense]|uniref:Glutathione S-transferase n=2 Tax=Rhizobium miluonense TaxID=411945 RepID=A0A1C3VEX3_9HYPH|nr:glutathione S-transferase [Rhizobium miluonense]
MGQPMKLYYCETLNPRKACAAARYLGVDVEFIRVDLARGEQRTPEFLALNPNGKVPVLTDGDLRLWEANAIMRFLSDRAGSDFWPEDARRFDITRWMSWDAAHFTRYGATIWFERLIKPLLGLHEDERIIEEACASLVVSCRIIDEHLAGRTWTVGSAVTAADFAIGAALPYADAMGFDFCQFRHLSRWYEALDRIDAWHDPFPLNLQRD